MTSAIQPDPIQPGPSQSDPVTIVIGASRLRLDDVVAIANRSAQASLFDDADFRARITRGADFVDRLIAEDGVVYGVTTGYG
ncbi:MAG TPA: aromatic amino acid lyase, partial [Xanthomonadaceae bacterium]|nr:aromatic amino acid lyase [Xanthomonadaceae bacterium]